MKFVTNIFLGFLFITISGCMDDPVREYTSIYSVNLETKKVTKRCNLGYGYEINYSAMENYFFSPDKKHFISIAYNEPDGYRALYYRDINSGVTLNTIASIEESEQFIWDVQFTKDEKKITFSQGYVYCVNVDGTQLKKLVIGTYPTFSPDGQKILFLAENGYLTLYDILQNSYKQLYYEDCIEYPIFHPNGEKIYFFDESDLKTFSLIDSTTTIIAEDLTFSGPIKFSNSGDRKVFYVFMKVFTLDEFDNINRLDLYSPEPCISSDGTKIAIAEGSLKIMDFNGSNCIELGHAINNTGIGFTPDDKEVFYIDTWKDE